MSANSIRTASFFLAAAILTGIPGVAAVLQSAASDDAVREALRVTARIGLVLYVVIFVVRPLQVLWPSALTRALLKNRRYIGVTFAGVMTAHLFFIMWRWVAGDVVLPAFVLVFGGGAYVCLYLMVITSFDAPARALGSRNWRRLHTLGIYWLGLDFANTVIRRLLRDPDAPIFIAEATLLSLAILLRVLAFLKTQRTAATDSAR